MRSSLSIAAALILLTGCTATRTATAAATPTAAPVVGCAAAVDTGPLPEWARTGFTGDSSMPHVLGERGEIVAAIFGYPLTASRSDGAANKILWVSKTPTAVGAGDLVIEGKLDGTSVTASRKVTGGPGPSIIDLPQPGCWHLDLTWPEHSDRLSLVFH